MLQRYHLVQRRPHSNGVLVESRRFAWLLPMVTAQARERASHVVSRFVERLNIHGTVACVTSGIVDRQTAGIDWLAVIDLGRGGCTCLIPLQEMAVDDLLDFPAILPVQSSLLRAYQRLSTTPPSALSPGWLIDATTWATAFLPDGGRLDPIGATPHRAELFEAMWEFRHPTMSFFLKWRGHGPFPEPELALIVATYGGARTPNTIACDRTSGRWLTEGLRGAPLTAQLSPAAIGRVAQIMALVQMNLVPVAQRLRSIGVPEESLVDLAAEGDRILDWLPCQSDHHSVQAARAAIHQACAELDALRLPPTWIHTDFVPENIFIDGNVVQFIDFDDPWIGPAPVVMEFLYGGLRRHIADMTVRSAAVAAACESFVRAWRALVAPDVMRQAFGSTRLLAEVLRVSRRLRAVAAKEKNGELAGFMEPAARESARRLVGLANSDLTRSRARSV
jgi:hypothetical protein